MPINAKPLLNSLSLTLIMALTFLSTVSAHAAIAKGETKIRIKDTGSRIEGVVFDRVQEHIEFYSDYSSTDRVEIAYKIAGNRILIAVNLRKGQASFSGRNIESGNSIKMSGVKKELLEDLLYHLQLNVDQLRTMSDGVNRTAIQMLARSTELLTEFAPEDSLDLDVVSDTNELQWRSLCNDIGRSKTARWDNASQARWRNFIVGGHGVCKGRCGRGCPWLGVYVYSQDCFNHDACSGEEGDEGGVCSDERFAAVDDYLLAPICD